MPAARRRARRSRVGSLFFTLGFLAMLAVTFGAGAFVGRTWPTFPGMLARARDGATRRDTRSERRPAEPGPVFTFYQELTAPLTAPPANAKPAKPAPPAVPVPVRPALAPAVPSRDDGAAAIAPAATESVQARPSIRADPAPAEPRVDAVVAHKPEAPPPGPAAAPATTPSAAEPASPGRFTIQVGAFKDRPPAEALRVTLAHHGHDAYIVEGDGGDVRFRVRVGSYATREEARTAAARIAAERHVGTYVTTR